MREEIFQGLFGGVYWGGTYVVLEVSLMPETFSVTMRHQSFPDHNSANGISGDYILQRW